MEELKKQLSAELTKPEPNPDILLELSNQIAALDESHVRFSVDAGIINRLGEELVAKGETAVAELVKNAYDADATEVSLFFENNSTTGGTLNIEDNGLGMTREELVEGFMRIASAKKVNEPISKRYQRERAGKKGIGRFAMQRLGTKVVIVTQTKEATHAIRVTINWEDFTSNKNIQTIRNNIVMVPRFKKEEGTIIQIENLRENWSKIKIERVYNALSDILQPFPLSKTKFTKETDEPHLRVADPGFKSHCYQVDKEKNEFIEVASENVSVFEHALAEIEGYVDANGAGAWYLKSAKLVDFKEEIFENGTFPLIKKVHFKAYYYITDKELLPAGTLGAIREILKDKGGIRFYQNGFRVFPYGEPQDDWLELDASMARKSILPTHSNKNFIGFVEINDAENHFRELANREGVIVNEHFKMLQKFIYETLMAAVLKIAELRGRKQKSGQKAWDRKFERGKKAVDEVVKAFEDIKKTIINDKSNKPDGNNDRDNDFKITKPLLPLVADKDLNDKFNIFREKVNEMTTVVEEQATEQQALIDEMNMLRVLAGIGLVIGEFTHEVKRFLLNLKLDADDLFTFTNKYPELETIAQSIKDNALGLNSFASYFDKTISQNALRELQTIDIRNVINAFTDTIKNDLSKAQIQLSTNFEGYNLFIMPMHQSEWASILFNFYSNAKKALKNSDDKGIQIKAGKYKDKIYVEFSDNGKGIPPENDAHIFNAFFTTNAAVGTTDDPDLSGSGLGLKIVKDIIDSYNGKIAVKRPANVGFKTTIRIELSKK
jgi:signal transduction histidine kinase